ncbi:MAG TPA: hypothetical protein VD994_02755 [Prosthecobacter sp.]|nr:hypothetical protein [Prosthecobacter sp.]
MAEFHDYGTRFERLETERSRLCANGTGPNKSFWDQYKLIREEVLRTLRNAIRAGGASSPAARELIQGLRSVGEYRELRRLRNAAEVGLCMQSRLDLWLAYHFNELMEGGVSSWTKMQAELVERASQGETIPGRHNLIAPVRAKPNTAPRPLLPRDQKIAEIAARHQERRAGSEQTTATEVRSVAPSETPKIAS